MVAPFFSIILPTYNRAHFLDRAITSVINQTFTDWELIVVDDGSTDNTRDIVNKYCQQDSRVKYFYQENKKLPTARNTGIILSVGKNICFIDSDDEFENKHLQIFYEAIKLSGEKFYWTNFRIIKDNNGLENIVPNTQFTYEATINNIMSVFLPYSPPVQCICVPKYIAAQVMFNKLMKVTEAYDFNARCASFIETCRLHIVSVSLHVHKTNVSVNNNSNDAEFFYDKQYSDFKNLRNDKFYKQIRNTKEFIDKCMSLCFELIKLKNVNNKPTQSLLLLLECIALYPSILFSKKIPILIYQIYKNRNSGI